MKKIISITITVFLLLSLMVGCGGGAPAGGGNTGDNVVKIGVFEPASGDNGAGGKQESLGVYYANQLTPTVTIDGVEYTVKLESADNQSSTEKAPSAAQTLVAAGCSVILGSYGSAVCNAAGPVFGDAGIPAIGITCTNPQVTLNNEHYFRICFLDPFQGTVLANLAQKQFDAKKAYVLAKLGDDYSVGLANYFMEAFDGEVVYDQFPDGTSDYSTYVTNAITQGAHVFFSPVSTEAAALIIDQAATQGMTIPILAGDTWDSNVILDAAMGKDLKIYVTTFYQEGGAPEFDSGIKDWLNANPTHLANNGGNDKIAAVSAMGFDAYYVALEALKAAGSTDPGDVLAILPDVTYSGVSGPIAFDENGDAIRDTAFVKLCNTETGEWEFFAQQGIN